MSLISRAACFREAAKRKEEEAHLIILSSFGGGTFRRHPPKITRQTGPLWQAIIRAKAPTGKAGPTCGGSCHPGKWRAAGGGRLEGSRAAARESQLRGPGRSGEPRLALEGGSVLSPTPGGEKSQGREAGCPSAGEGHPRGGTALGFPSSPSPPPPPYRPSSDSTSKKSLKASLLEPSIQ